MVLGGAGGNVFTGGKGADDITGGAGANTFVYTTLNSSLTATFDTIQDFKTTDSFKIGRTISSSNLKTASGSGTGALAVDLAATLTSSNFIANAATVVTLTGGSDSGRYLVLNDGSAAFSATSDAVIKLAGSVAVANTNFIV